jgi:hypothetical protein
MNIFPYNIFNILTVNNNKNKTNKEPVQFKFYTVKENFLKIINKVNKNNNNVYYDNEENNSHNNSNNNNNNNLNNDDNNNEIKMKLSSLLNIHAFCQYNLKKFETSIASFYSSLNLLYSQQVFLNLGTCITDFI